MKLIAIFEDTPEMPAIRAQYQDLHFAFLEKHHDEIIAAGGLVQPGRPGYIGGMWIFLRENETRALELIAMDPYARGNRPFRLLRWGKALPQYSCTI